MGSGLQPQKIKYCVSYGVSSNLMRKSLMTEGDRLTCYLRDMVCRLG
ncbi:unnamed protein product [Ixodes persulcatus]